MKKNIFKKFYMASLSALLVLCLCLPMDVYAVQAEDGEKAVEIKGAPTEVYRAQKAVAEKQKEEARIAAAKKAAAEQAAFAEEQMQIRAGLIASGVPIPQPVRGPIMPDTTGYTLLAAYATSYNDNIPRATNITLAANRINGYVLQPGEVFSFTNTILPRTVSNGYVAGPIFVQKEHSMGIGGGICQVSSTLYACTLTAGIPAVERHEHGLPVTYIPAGMDATIDGTRLDFKFANIYDKPMMISATPDFGTLTVGLWLKN